jgi:hypothetical protein
VKHIINSGFILLCLAALLVSASTYGPEGLIDFENRFNDCEHENTKLISLKNDTFKIKYPEFWKEDNQLKNGLDISSSDFPDSNLRTVLLTIVPYSQFKAFARKNPMVNYYLYSEGEFKGHDAVFMIRNDLKKGNDDTVFWRAELKLIDEKNDLLYILVFGKPAHMNQEPNWCEFSSIVKSLSPQL